MSTDQTPDKNDPGRLELEKELEQYREKLKQLVEERTGELSNAIRQLQQEISVREEAELRLSETRERYDLATRAAKVGVWDWNIEANNFYLDSNVKAILGYGNEEIPNDLDVWFEYVYPEDRDDVSKTIQEHFDGNTPEFVSQHRMVHKDGSIRWIMVRGRAIRNAEGKVVRMVGTDMDISDYKKVEIAIQESEERYRAVVEQSRDCIFLVEFETRRIVEANPTFFRLLGYNHEDLTTLTLYDFVDHERSDVDERIQTIAKEKGYFLGERRYRRKDGTIIPVEVSANLVQFGGKKVMCIVSRDITDRKRQDEERRRLESQMQESQRFESLGVLAGGVAHDFNNMLVGVLGSVSLALDQISSDSSVGKLLRQIDRSALRAAELSKQLLAYSGKGRFVVEPINLSEIVKDMRDLVSASISKKTIVNYHLRSQVRPIEADATEVRQVVMNLVLNASESFAKDGTVKVTTGEMKCTRDILDSAVIGNNAPEGDYVFLEVVDAGCGIEEETMPRIFDPYFSTKESGRGLGLAAVLGIVRGHNGVLQVESEPGGGSIFRVLFPALEKRVAVRTQEQVQPEREHHLKTVLVVDDEEIIRELSKQMLERNGFKVLTAVDGQDGIKVFRTHHDEIDIVLLDLTMPRLDGEETYKELCRIKSSVKILFSSGYGKDMIVDRFRHKGNTGFVQKPYHAHELIRQIRNLG